MVRRLVVCCASFGAAVVVTMLFFVSSLSSPWVLDPQAVHNVIAMEIVRQFPGYDTMRLDNISLPWFTVFPEDEHLSSNLSFFRKRKEIITKLPSEYTLKSKNICENSRKIKLLIVVPSVASNLALRQAIRTTWASPLYDSQWKQNEEVRIAFFFGDSALGEKDKDTLREESAHYGDIVTINMNDTYEALSLKIASILFWSVKTCNTAEYVAKIDMDTLVNLPLLLKLLEARPSIPACNIGFKHGYNHPQVVRSGRWAIPSSVYPFDLLPRYAYGHSYVLTREAVDRVVSSLPYFPIVPNEDAFITGIMSLVANVTRIHSPAFAHLFLKQTIRDVYDNRFVSSIHKKDNLLNIWDSLQRGNRSYETVS